MKVKVTLDFIITLITAVVQAIQKKDEFKEQWDDVVREWNEAKQPDSEGGELITFGEIFNEIAPEFREAICVYVPFLDKILDMFDGKEEVEE